MHHLSTEERRLTALREMGRILKSGGHMLVYVWAMEQHRKKVVPVCFAYLFCCICNTSMHHPVLGCNKQHYITSTVTVYSVCMILQCLVLCCH